MALKTLADLEELEGKVMQIAGQETEILVNEVAREDQVSEAVKNEATMERQRLWKKNVGQTYMLCERILRYVAARKLLGKNLLEKFPEAELRQAQEVATRGATAARAKMHLIGGNGTRG